MIPRTRSRVRASYDVSGYDPDNAKHWAYATGESADATASAETRRTVRNRARYEVGQNNSYGRGIVNTLADDTIGTGPRLQLTLDDDTINTAVESEWRYWSAAANLPSKLRTMKAAKTIDGEAVAKIVTNPPLPADCKLDLQLVECDRLSSPLLGWDTSTYIDGVTLDEYGNPTAYDILRQHPGSLNYTSSLLEYDRFSRSQVIHFFRRDRPEQHRGVSEVVSSLPLFAMMRRFTLATVTAAETAANHAMVLETEAPFDDSEDLTWEAIELQRNAATMLPGGTRLGQISAEHPSTTYQMFKREILNELGRCLCMPYNVAAADSSGYNYASGRLDHQVYDRAIKVEQAAIGCEVLDRVLGEWLIEASLLGILPAGLSSEVLAYAAEYGSEGVALRIPHVWQWDKRPHVDPSKEANAQRVRLQNGTTSREIEMLEMGLDINEVDSAAALSYGLELEQYRRIVGASLLTNGNMTGVNPTTEEQPAEPEDGGDDEQSSEA